MMPIAVVNVCGRGLINEGWRARTVRCVGYAVERWLLGSQRISLLNPTVIVLARQWQRP